MAGFGCVSVAGGGGAPCGVAIGLSTVDGTLKERDVMDFTRPINATGTSPKRKGRWGRRLLLAVGAVLVLLAAAVGAAPTVLSTAWARAFVLAKVNAALAPARVEVRDWSLAWFGAQCVEGVAYEDARSGVQAKARALRVGSLWALLPLGKMTVEVAVEAPEVTLGAAAKAAPSPVAPAPAPAESAPRAPFALPAWDLSARLTITEATVRLAALPEPLVTQGKAELTVPSLDKDIVFALGARLLGDATLSTEATLPSAQALLAATAPADFLRRVNVCLEAPWAQVVAVATAEAEGAAWPEAKCNAELRLAEAFARAKAFGAEVPGLEALAGGLTLAATIAPARTAGAQSVTLDLHSKEVACTYEGKALRLSPRLNLAATVDPERPLAATLERLSLDFPGLLASGSGSLAGGTLVAQLEANELLATFAPFVGGFQLPAPLSVRLDARAEGGVFGLTAKARSGQATLADVTAKAEGIDLAAQSVRSAKLGVKADLAAAARFAPLPEGQSLAGTLYLNAAAAGSPTELKGSLAVALRDIAYRAASWKVDEPSLLEGEATFEGGPREPNGAFPDWLLAVPTLRLTMPIATLEGSASYVPRGGMSLSAKGAARPGDALAKWRVWGKDETPLTLAGTLAYSLQGSYDAQKTGRALVELASEDFAVTLPDTPAIVLPFTLKADAAQGETATRLDAFSLTSPYLTLSAKGGLKDGHARLEGEWTPNLTRAFADLPFFGGLRKHVTVTGNAARPFAFEAPIDQGAAGILSYGKGNAEVAIDRVTVPGLDIPGGTVKATLAEGVAALDGRLTVNGGTVRLTPRVALTAQPYALTVPDGAKVLEGVALTQELMDAAFKVVNPLLAGSATPQGTVDLVCDSLTLPLAGDPLRESEAKLTLLTHGCGVAPNGMLGTLLGLLHVKDRMAYLPDQTFGVRVAEGTLTCDPIHMRIAAVRLECTGSTNLVTRELDYTLALPLTQQLLGDRLAKRLKVGETLRLPIGGTFDKPALDTAPVLGALADSALGRAADRLTERLGKTLQKGGEAGMEAGGAVGDVLRATGETGADVGEKVGDALRSLFDRKRKKK